LVPALEARLRATIENRKTIQSIAAELDEARRRVSLAGGMRVDVAHLAKRRAQSNKSYQSLKDTIAEIEALGVQVKDLDMGLLDFPCRVEGRTVLLCWKLGEPSISYWHELDAGFAGRQPIDEKISKTKKRDR
jgi:hypothetical protein